MSAINYNWADVYPNMGQLTTSLSTVADPDDQQAMVDSEELAVTHQVKNDGAKGSKIWIAIVAFLCIVMCLGLVKS